ncbi:MAG: hypothetical protein HYX41_01110 [Bdellovibrio sp.]|nr:hypothetical protein [Bdellovibrio sp.]
MKTFRFLPSLLVIFVACIAMSGCRGSDGSSSSANLSNSTVESPAKRTSEEPKKKEKEADDPKKFKQDFTQGRDSNLVIDGAFWKKAEKCEIDAIEDLQLKKYLGREPYKDIVSVYLQQIKKLEKDRSVFGQFKEYQPINVGYAKEYGVMENSRKGLAKGLIDDATFREFIEFKNSSEPVENLFAKLFDHSSDRNKWNPEKAKPHYGLGFAGYKISPKYIQQHCGLWADIFLKDKKQNKKRNFETLFDGTNEFDGFDFIFDLPTYKHRTTNSIFLSTTRSIHVARRFAIGSGARRDAVKEAWVYVIHVENGFDSNDPHSGDPGFFEGEQEVTVTGMIPWSRIIGYRKIVAEPSPGAPAEFVGPIHLREGLETQEPEAFKSAVHQLSMKSKFSQEFEGGLDWDHDFEE